MSTVVVKKTEATVAGIPVCGTAEFVWNSHEPMAVNMTVNIGLQPVTWQFARELLDAAFITPGENAGRGDVIILVEHARVRFWLSSDDGQKRAIYVPLQPLMDFVLQTIALLPIEDETADVDAAIEQLLGGELA